MICQIDMLRAAVHRVGGQHHLRYNLLGVFKVYARVVDYLAEPEPPLKPEDAVWADYLLRAAGLH